MTKHDVAHGGVENGIAEKLQTLVVHEPSILVTAQGTFVHERHAIVADVVRIDADDGI